MNQILYVEEKKKQKADIKNVIRFFSIAIIIFGIVLISQGSYALYNNSSVIGGQEESKPMIDTQEDDGKLFLTVTHEKGISRVVYHWNEEADITIQGNNQTRIEEEIEMPVGENTLTIKIYDKKNKETVYQQEYQIEDLGESKIDFVIENNTSTMKIKATDTKGLSYITYRWNDEVAQTVKAEGNDLTTIEKAIEIPFGLNTLTVVAVNVDGITKTSQQEIKGVKTTKVGAELTTIGEKNAVKIKLTDESGIKSIHLVWNETETHEIDVQGEKEKEFSLILHEGENRINLTIMNNDDVKTEQNIIVNN